MVILFLTTKLQPYLAPVNAPSPIPLQMYTAPKGYYAVITFGDMNEREPVGVHTFRVRYNTLEELYTETFKSLYDARCSMSNVIDVGLSFLRET